MSINIYSSNCKQDGESLGIMFDCKGYIPADSARPKLPEIRFRGIKIEHKSGSGMPKRAPL